MATKRPSLRAQWLGQSLRELRDGASMTLAQAADYIQRNPATLSRFESGEYLVRRPDLLALLDHYGVTDRAQRDGLLQLAEDGWQRGWWDGYASEVERDFIDFVWLESRASRIDLFDTTLLPGLFQTAQYAEAVIRADEHDSAPEQVRRWVQLRAERQAALHRADPPRVRAILDEPVLRRPIDTREVWRAQLTHLLTCAALPHVELRVLPADAVPHRGMRGGFIVFGLAEPTMDVGYVETLGGALYVEPPDSDRFTRVYDDLLRRALAPEASAELIRTILEE